MMTTRQIPADAKAAIRKIEAGVADLRAATGADPELVWAAYSRALHALVGGVPGIPDDKTWVGRMKVERYAAAKALAAAGAGAQRPGRSGRNLSQPREPNPRQRPSGGGGGPGDPGRPRAAPAAPARPCARSGCLAPPVQPPPPCLGHGGGKGHACWRRDSPAQRVRKPLSS